MTVPSPQGDRIVAEVHLTPRDVMGVSARRLLLHRLSLTAVASGPVLWLAGVAGGSAEVTRLGLALMWLVAVVPLFAFLIATMNAYRPGTAELYAPVTYTFSVDGIEIEQPDRRAHASWDEFGSWRMVGGEYLLDLSKTRYLVVPQAAVPAAQRSAFAELLEAHLGSRRR